MKIPNFIKPACFRLLLWFRNGTAVMKRIFSAVKPEYPYNGRLRYLIDEKMILVKGPKVVAIGGGTGLSTMLRGLKQYSSNITAVVTVADDGGGSGVLRQDLKMLPPGDIRNCILALADTEPIMEQLLQYRFTEGMLKGQSFGNLFLAAMDGISENFEQAVKKMGDVLAVTGMVLPVTLEDMRLKAELADGSNIYGESQIGGRPPNSPPIRKVCIEPSKVKPCPDVLNAIRNADVIILGPGSLYTSIIPNLLVEGICDEIKKSGALKVYVCNIMTQPGETEGYTAHDHIKALERHAYEGIVQYCIVNSHTIPDTVLERYRKDGAGQVRVDAEEILGCGIKLITGDFACINDNLVRHNPAMLAETILRLVADNVLAGNRDRIIDYYYIKDRLKK